MSTRGHWHPWRHLADHHSDIDVEFADLGPGLLGYTDFAGGRIVLDRQLSQRERRCTLTHELWHIHRGRLPADPHLQGREHHAVDHGAARQLVTLDDLVQALLWSTDPEEVADELWVDGPTLRARLDGLQPHEREAIASRLADAPQWSA